MVEAAPPPPPPPTTDGVDKVDRIGAVSGGKVGVGLWLATMTLVGVAVEEAVIKAG